MYKIYTNEDPDEEVLPCEITSFYRLATLEVVVKDKSGIASLVLILGSYALDSIVMEEHGEGYWGPPNVAYHFSAKGYTSPSTLGSLRENFEDEDIITEEKMKMDIQQLAYSLGLRDTRVTHAGSFIEIKKSPRTPNEITRAYHIDRFILIRVEPNSLRNIADPELWHGLVFAPLDINSPYYEKRMSASHEIEEVWFLGKPLQTNVKYLLENKPIVTKLVNSAKDIKFENFSMNESGIICAIDISGYGEALRYTRCNMTSYRQTGDEIMTDFRFDIRKNLIDFVSELGTTQVQIAGDGLICTFPSRIYKDINLLVKCIINKWEKTIGEIKKLNSKIKDENKKVGSRIALIQGAYQYGRINGIFNFSPAFDGQSIMEAVRLEQGLSAWIKENAESKKHNMHYLAYIKKNVCIPITLNNWSDCGEHVVSSKEYTALANILTYTVKEVEK